MDPDFIPFLKSASLKKSIKLSRTEHLRAKSSEKTHLSEGDISRVIEMAWEDRTPFEAIQENYNLSETQVIKLMRKSMKASSFKMWRKRVTSRKTKHLAKRGFKVGRAFCPTQYKR
jgi:uncharacterized protein (TIGR03643 family)